MPLTNYVRDSVLAAGIRGAVTHLGVGDSLTAFSATHTDLQAATNTSRKPFSTGPGGTGDDITATATWTTGEANFAWQEWGLFDAGTGGNMYNRKVESLGTKTASQSWELSVTLTVTVPQTV